MINLGLLTQQLYNIRMMPNDISRTLTVSDLKKFLNDFNDTDEVFLHSVVLKNEPYQFEDCGDFILVDVPASISVSHRNPSSVYAEGQCWIYSKGII